MSCQALVSGIVSSQVRPREMTPMRQQCSETERHPPRHGLSAGRSYRPTDVLRLSLHEGLSLCQVAASMQMQFTKVADHVRRGPVGRTELGACPKGSTTTNWRRCCRRRRHRSSTLIRFRSGSRRLRSPKRPVSLPGTALPAPRACRTPPPEPGRIRDDRSGRKWGTRPLRPLDEACRRGMLVCRRSSV